MYKSITNCPAEVTPGKSLVCSQLETGKIPTDQLLCCFDNKCSADPTDLVNCAQPKQLSHCHNITNLDACQRIDQLARQVCDWQGGFFCLSTKGLSTGVDYTGLPEGIKWMLNRNKNGSYAGTTAYYDGQTYQLCSNSTNCDWNANCTDLFQNGCAECDWKNGTIIPGNPRRIKGELCEIIPTETVVASAIPLGKEMSSNSPLVIGLSTTTSVFGVAFLVILGTIVWRKFNRRNAIPTA